MRQLPVEITKLKPIAYVIEFEVIMTSWWSGLFCVSRPANGIIRIPMDETMELQSVSLEDSLMTKAPDPMLDLLGLSEENLSVSTWNDVINQIDTNGKTAQYFLKQNTNDKQKSILHYVCESPEANDELANEVMYKIVEKTNKLYWKDGEWFHFVNLQTTEKYTALHYAIDNKHKKIVEFLLMYEANVGIRAMNENKKALSLIYNSLHVVVLKLFDDGFKVIKDKYDLENELLWKLKCNFSSISGVSRTEEMVGNQASNANDNLDYCQSFFLAQILHQQYTKAPVLMHPLSQIFLYEKGKKMKGYIWISMVYHVAWSLLVASYFVLNFNELHNHNQTFTTHNMTSTSSSKNIQFQNLTQVLVEDLEQLSDSHLVEKRKTEKVCLNPGCGGSSSAGHHVLFGFVLAFWIIALIKEIIEYKISPSTKFYRGQFENWGQILVLILVPATTILTYAIQFWENSSSVELIAWRESVFVLNTIGIGIALLLIQGQVTKSETFGIYNQMLIMVFVKFVTFLVAFVPMLFAFLALFYRLIPEKQDLWFYGDWFLGINKVLAMMTGELTYDELYSDRLTTSKIYWIPAEIVFVLFLVLITVMLQNLLLGLTVSDVERLREDALVHHLASRLEIIHLAERILSCDRLKAFMNTCCLGCLLKWLLNKSCLNQEDFYGLQVSMQDLPKRTRKSISYRSWESSGEKKLRHEHKIEAIENHFKSRSEGYYSKPLEVKVVKPISKMFHKNDYYKLDPEKIGLALVLNITEFNNSAMRRTGAEKDSAYMHKLFSELGYQVFAYTGYFTKKELEKIVKEFLEEFSKQPNQMSCVVYLGTFLDERQKQVLSDGGSFDLYTDFIHKFTKHEVLGKVKNNVSKPKIFIINSVQPRITEDGKFDPLELQDTIICWAAFPGTIGFRDHYNGTWFAYSLTDVFMKAAYNTELQEMFEMVCRNVSINTLQMEQDPYERRQLMGIPVWLAFNLKPLYFNVAPDRPSAT